MSKWGTVKLSEAFDLQMGKTPSRSNLEYWNDGANKWVSIADIGLAEKYIYKTKETITDLAVAESGIKIVPKNTVIMSFKLSLGKTCIVSENMYTNEAIMAFIDKGKYEIDKNYLYHLFRGRDWSVGTNKAVMGITLNKTTLSIVEIPLPPLETQKQIAKTLDTAAELLAMRKQQLAELDNLIKSTFYDMFGDPVTNSLGWETSVLSNCLVRIESGWSPKCEDRAVIEKEWGICKLSAVTRGHYKEIENKAILKDTKINLALEVKNGDLLFCRKNTFELVGSCAYVFESTKKLMIPDTIFRFCTKGNIHKLYLWGLLNCQTFKPFVQRLAGGTSGSMPNISKERLNGLEIPLPPKHLQTQFAEIVTKIEEQKALVKKAIDETQYLFDSLLNDYFE